MERAAFDSIALETPLKTFIGILNIRLKKLASQLQQTQEVRVARTTSALPPGLTDVPQPGQATLHRDTNTSKVWLGFNDAGVVKKVELV